MRAADLAIAPDARAALMPLLGGDRRASRAELRKLVLYPRGKERIEVDDILAVVADASALAIDALIDAAFAQAPPPRSEGIRQGDDCQHRAGPRPSALHSSRSSGCVVMRLTVEERDVRIRSGGARAAR